MRLIEFMTMFLGADESSISARISELPEEQALDAFEELISERQEKKVEALFATLTTEDDLGRVVRAHIHIEHELQELILFAAPSPSHLKSFDKMEFSEKVQLALVLGLNADLKAALAAAGNLRNKFSHRLDMKIGEQEANNLIATFKSSAKQRFQAIFHKIVSESKPLESEDLVRFRVILFFLHLFDEVAQERRRLAFEKMGRMTSQ
jgi:hypothetical protein